MNEWLCVRRKAQWLEGEMERERKEEIHKGVQGEKDDLKHAKSVTSANWKWIGTHEGTLFTYYDLTAYLQNRKKSHKDNL